MIAWAALLWLLPLQDSEAERPKSDDAALREEVNRLRKDVEGLQKELEDVRERLTSSEKQAVEDAGTIQRLRQALRNFEKGSDAAPSADAKATPENPSPGPAQPLRAKIEYVDGKLGFVVVGAGKKEGVIPGFRFEVVRTDYEEGGTPKHQKIAVGEFEKFIGSEEGMSKIKIVEGKAADVRVGDEAVAVRKLDAPAAPEAAAAAAKQGVYKITGHAGTGFAIDFGSEDGARQTEVLYVYKDGHLKAKLRLDTVQNNFSIANVIDGSQIAEPEIGDQVYVGEMKKSVTGKIRINTEVQGILVDVGTLRDGAKPGQRFEVRRLGKKVGTIRIVTSDKYHSYAKPDGATKREDLQVGDNIELVAEK